MMHESPKKEPRTLLKLWIIFGAVAMVIGVTVDLSAIREWIFPGEFKAKLERTLKELHDQREKQKLDLEKIGDK